MNLRLLGFGRNLHAQSLFVLLILSALSAPVPASGDEAGGLERELRELGFENVSVSYAPEGVTVSCENTVYRYGPDALRELVRLSEERFPGRRVTITLGVNGVPILKLHAGPGGSSAASFHPEWPQGGGGRQPIRADVTIRPGLKLVLGNYDDPFKVQLNAVPELDLTLRRGLSFRGQLLLPLMNELERAGNYIRPGTVALNYTRHVNPGLFISTTAGKFNPERLGLVLESKKFLGDGRISVGLQTSISWYVELERTTWLYSKSGVWTLDLSASYAFTAYNLIVSAGGGRFLAEDVGGWVEAKRRFGETEIAFFSIWTDEDQEGGFRITVPIYPPKRPPRGRLRITPPLRFPWTYRYRSSMAGISPSTGFEVEELTRYLEPWYVEGKLDLQ